MVAPPDQLEPPPKTVDMKALARLLPPRWRRLRQLIEDVAAVHSARVDLMIAANLAQRLCDLPAERSNMPKQLAEDTGIAFLFATVVMYTRATKSRSKHRKTFDLRAMMTPQELSTHKLIYEIRDDAIAHYGPGFVVPGMQIREDHVLLVDGSQLQFASKTLAGSASFAAVIHNQVQRALFLMQRLHEEREDELIDYWNENTEELVNSGIWKGAVVDLVEAVGPQMAEQLNALPRVGHHRVSQSD